MIALRLFMNQRFCSLSKIKIPRFEEVEMRIKEKLLELPIID